MSTIKDVAQRAGVAMGTASRVLSGSTQTSPDSRARVLAAAAELNYVMNGLARALRRSRTDVLGLLVSDIRNPFFSELAHAAESEAMRRGYTVLLANADENAAQADEYLRAFASQRIDGLLLAPQGPVSPQLESLVASKLPIPPLAPVTRATLPVKSCSCLFLVSGTARPSNAGVWGAGRGRRRARRRVRSAGEGSRPR